MMSRYRRESVGVEKPIFPKGGSHSFFKCYFGSFCRHFRNMIVLAVSAGATLGTVQAMLVVFASSGDVQADAYTSSEIDAIMQPSLNGANFYVEKDFTLPAGSVLRRPLVVETSDVVVDLNGGSISNIYPVGYVIQMRSKHTGGSWTNSANWDRLSNVVIKNGTIHGGIHIYGMAMNGQGMTNYNHTCSDEYRLSSYCAGHTERVQAAAPTGIILQDLIQISYNVGLYYGPGVTYTTVTNCLLTGARNSIAAYLDAESAHNTFYGNEFDYWDNGPRELIAIDGSAYNEFRYNIFGNMEQGGLYLYRNPGEGGVVRHQTPYHNVIANNTFDYSVGETATAVWIGSREGSDTYCDDDAGYPYGSSISDYDWARENIVIRNDTTLRDPSAAIVEAGFESGCNTIEDNFKIGGTYYLTPQCAESYRLSSVQNIVNSSNAFIWYYVSSVTSPQWVVTYMGDGKYKIANQSNTSMVLECADGSAAAGTNVRMWSDASVDFKRWRIHAFGWGKYLLKPAHSPSMALEVADGVAANGANARINVINAQTNTAQRWSFTPVP